MKNAHRSDTAEYLPILVTTAAAFVLGAALGGILASRIGDSSAMSDYLSGFAGYGNAENGLDFLSALSAVLRFPFLVFLCGFITGGRFFIPPLLAVRGLLLGFATASFYRLFGLHGLIIAGAVFVPGCLFSIPSLFGLSVKAIQNSRKDRQGGFLNSNRQYLAFSLICFGLLIVGAAAEVWVGAPLLDRVIGR